MTVFIGSLYNASSCCMVSTAGADSKSSVMSLTMTINEKATLAESEMQLGSYMYPICTVLYCSTLYYI